ncbi:MAG: hypothetical protein Q4C71_03580 [Microbacteriaceae bacterium]|nr:hypothetical protein [Microbacteriaceae bacterium]
MSFKNQAEVAESPYALNADTAAITTVPAMIQRGQNLTKATK